MLLTSANALRQLLKKAELLGLHTQVLSTYYSSSLQSASSPRNLNSVLLGLFLTFVCQLCALSRNSTKFSKALCASVNWKFWNSIASEFADMIFVFDLWLSFVCDVYYQQDLFSNTLMKLLFVNVSWTRSGLVSSACVFLNFSVLLGL